MLGYFYLNIQPLIINQEFCVSKIIPSINLLKNVINDVLAFLLVWVTT